MNGSSTGVRAALFRAIDVDALGRGRRRVALSLLPPAIVAVGLGAMMFDTALPVGSPEDLAASGVVIAIWAILALEFLARLWTAPEGVNLSVQTPASARAIYLGSAHGLIDLAAAVSLPAAFALGIPAHDANLFAIAWALKFIRHSSGLSLLVRVALRSRAALLSVAMVFFVVLLLAATLAYVFERRVQPEVFSSIPVAMWWAIVTLTTTGYGDVVPQTLWGRLLAGWVMVSGIAVFALWAGIIANAFTEELRRRDFLRNWDLVARVPFFQNLGAAAIADVVRLLQPRDAPKGAILFREGQPGDSMFFLVSGEARVDLRPAPVTLGPGSFVGEMALLFGQPRSATVTMTKPSLLLVLDIADFRELAGRRPELIDVIEAEGRRRRDANIAATH